MNTLSTITLLPASKKELKDFSGQIINEVLEGNINPLELDARLKYIEELVKTIRTNKDVKECKFIEAKKYGKTFEYANCEIRLSERKVYDFKQDSEVVRLEKELKARKELLKTVKDGIIIIDEATGEELQEIPTTTTEIITYKIK